MDFTKVHKIKWDTELGFTTKNKRVSGMVLEKCELTILPDSIGQLKLLQTLNLEYNELTSLPESIGQLKSLETLNLFENKLRTLPESIGNLSSLQKLELRYNKLTTLPESIGNLTSLKILWLGLNQLTTLPESLGKLTSLHMLQLFNNELSILPESIGQLKSLQTLILDYNKLSTLPESIGNLTSLQTLKISENRLTKLPESIGRLKSLETLNLDHNKLSTLPESIGQLYSLIEIKLNENKWEVEWAEMQKNDILYIRKLCRKLHGIVIFISHAWDDQKQYQIVELKRYLEDEVTIREQDITLNVVHDVFICEEDVVENIQKFMIENVPKSQLLVFVATKNSLKSQACRFELYLARKFGVKIVPIKDFNIQWTDLQHINTSEFDQKELDLSNPEEIFEYNNGCKNFSKICEKLGNYIKTHESELKKSKKKAEEMENAKRNFIELIDSEEFRAIVGKNVDIFKKLFQEVSKNQITTSEYYLKLGQTLKERGN